MISINVILLENLYFDSDEGGDIFLSVITLFYNIRANEMGTYIL